MIFEQLIGNTPLVEVNGFSLGCCRLFLKCENYNLTGSIKDRIAFAMIKDAEQKGLIKPGDTLVEASSGNVGLALAHVATVLGYRLIIVIPDKMSQEKIDRLRATHAEVVVTRSDINKGHPEYYSDVAERLARERGAFYLRQFENPANVAAHETMTAPELWRDMQALGEKIDAIVMGVGTGGHLSGVSRYFSKVSPATELILADPLGSVLADHVEAVENPQSKFDQWLVEGVGEDFVPPICDLSRVKKAYRVSDTEAFQAALDLLTISGIYAGTSTGLVLSAALRYCQEQTKPKNVVTFVYDLGDRYLSKMYNPTWRKKYNITLEGH